MSYILDALRRADAERERGSVPGLHAQPVPAVSADAARQRRARPLPWIVVGLSVGLLGPLAWQLAGRSDAPLDGALAPDAASPASSNTSPAALPARPPITVPPPNVAAAPVAPPIAVPPPVAVTAPPPSSIDSSAPAPRRSPPATTGATARAPARATNATDLPSAGAPEPRVYTLAELPDELRRELPALAIGGSIYSEHPANRFVIINGQTFREKDQIAPGLSLQQIRLKAAVLEYKGYRYSIAY